MKTCSRCNIEKELTDFHKRKTAKDGLMSYCKVCAHKGTMASRHKKPEHYRKVSRELSQSYMEQFQEWKAQQKCCKCGESETCCLDLHHLDPTQKDIAVSIAASRWTWNKLQTEIQKCIVVCRNCHAKIHAGLLGALAQLIERRICTAKVGGLIPPGSTNCEVCKRSKHLGS